MSYNGCALEPADIYYIVSEAIVAVASVVGNCMVVLAVKVDKSLRNVTFFFIVSLAVADISCGIVLIPLAITIAVGLQTSFYGCLLMACIILTITQGSILSLLAIAVDRFLKVKMPTRYRCIVTPFRGCVAVGICWSTSALLGMLPIFGWHNRETIKTEQNSTDDHIKCEFGSVIKLEYMMFFNVLGWFFPLTIMIMLYAAVFYIIRKQFSFKTENGQQSINYYKKEMKLAKSLSLVLLLFALTFIPMHAMNIIEYACSANIKKSIKYTGIILSHLNSAVNPVVYAFRIKKFRRVFIRIGSLNISNMNVKQKRLNAQFSSDDNLDSNRTYELTKNSTEKQGK
ncbi:adenosine receptor A1-like [Protopterus annectens]|uniref:adenosine receptor A1-like n=1 Tax=Protopterus annectens TaxID=7888 RepID=UPI001CFAE153|nr:adenosine receptor A1-like [Protopterus annectens]